MQEKVLGSSSFRRFCFDVVLWGRPKEKVVFIIYIVPSRHNRKHIQWFLKAILSSDVNVIPSWHSLILGGTSQSTCINYPPFHLSPPKN